MAGRTSKRDVPSGAQNEPRQVGIARPCAAHGCPLGGTWSWATTGDSDATDWWCYIHSGLQGYDYQRVTHAIRQESAAVNACSSKFLEYQRDRGGAVKEYMAARGKLYDAVVARLRGEL